MSIEQRPTEVNDRIEPGHWEIDTVVGTRNAAPVLLTIDERSSRKRHVIKIASRSAESVSEGIGKLKAIYGERFSEIFKSITSDNGSEFSNLSELLTGIPIYYSHPYSSFERGTNEKQNSLIRRFFPKGKCFENVSDEAVAHVENWINDLPRKIFNYRSANESFATIFHRPI